MEIEDELLDDASEDSDDDGDATPPPKKKPAQNDPVNWKAKYDGMKGTAVKHQRRAEKLAQQLQELQERYETDTLSLTTERDTFKTQATQFKTAADQHLAEATKLQKRTELGRMIRKDFSVLAELYDDGLLDGSLEGLEAEAQKDFLTRYAAKIDGVKTEARKQSAEGTTPPPPTGGNQQPAATTLKDAQAKLQSVMSKGIHSPEYKAAYEEYTNALLNGATS